MVRRDRAGSRPKNSRPRPQLCGHGLGHDVPALVRQVHSIPGVRLVLSEQDAAQGHEVGFGGQPRLQLGIDQLDVGAKRGERVSFRRDGGLSPARGLPKEHEVGPAIAALPGHVVVTLFHGVHEIVQHGIIG